MNAKSVELSLVLRDLSMGIKDRKEKKHFLSPIKKNKMPLNGEKQARLTTQVKYLK